MRPTGYENRLGSNKSMTYFIDCVEFIRELNAEFFTVKENFAIEDIWTECVADNKEQFPFLDGQPCPIVIVCETTNVFILIALYCITNTR
jgi:hypothetical protein